MGLQLLPNMNKLQAVFPPAVKPKPVDQKALRSAVSLIAGAISMNPIGRGLVGAITLIADKATQSNQASEYLSNGKQSNETINMFLPGGLFAQNLASVASSGSSNDYIQRFVTDPKRIAMMALAAKQKPNIKSMVVTQAMLDKMEEERRLIPKSNPNDVVTDLLSSWKKPIPVPISIKIEKPVLKIVDDVKPIIKTTHQSISQINIVPPIPIPPISKIIEKPA